MAMTGVQLEGLKSKRYDPGLTYEERSAVRKQERKKVQEERAKSSTSGLNSRSNGSASRHQPAGSSSHCATNGLQNGGPHHRSSASSEGTTDDEGIVRNGKVSSPSPAPLSFDPTNRQSVSSTGEPPEAAILPSHTRVERNGHDDSSDFFSPLTPAETYDFSQRRNTPVLSRAQIEAIMSSGSPSRRDSGFSSQRRDTPVLSPAQLRTITEMSKDSVAGLFDRREDLILGPEASNSPLGTESHNRNQDDFPSEFQSILNGMDGDHRKDSRDGASSSLSRLSTHSSSSGFTVDGLDQLLSPKGPKSTDTSSASHFFSSNLQFVDTEESPISPILKEPKPTIRGQAQKTTVVYGDHEDGGNGLVTMIPSSGFFDPSQSQADVLDDNPLPVLDNRADDKSAPAKKSEGESKKKKKVKEAKKSSKRDKTLLHARGDVSEKILEEDEEESQDGDEKMTTQKKEEKEGRTKKLFGSRRSNDFNPLSHAARLHESTDEEKPRALERSASSSSGKKSFSPFRKAKKTSQSFRDELQESSTSSDRVRLRKISLDSSPSPSRSFSSREATPESSGSDASGGKQTKKRKTSLAQRIKSLVAGGNSKENAVKSSVPDNLEVKTLQVADHVESSSEFTTSGSNLDIPLLFSGSFEDSIASVTSCGSLSAKKETFPSRPQSAIVAPGSHPMKVTKKQVNDLEMPEVKSRLNLSPRSGTKSSVHLSGARVQKKSTGGGGMGGAKNSGSPVAKGPSSISSPTAASPRSVIRGTSVPGKKAPAVSPQSSVKGRSEVGKGSPLNSPKSRTSSGLGRGSPISSPRSSEKRRASSALGKGSPIGSPRSSTRGSSSSPGAAISPRSSGRGSVDSGKGSPRASRQSSTQGSLGSGKVVSPLLKKKVSSTSSPTPKNKSSITVISKKTSASTSAPKNSPLASSKSSPTKLTTSASASSVSPGSPKGVSKAKAASPSSHDASPPGSPRIAKKSGQLSSAPSKASPLMLRKTTPSTSGQVNAKVTSTSSVTINSSSKRTSVPSSVTRKPAPPRLTKMDLDSPEVNSPNVKKSPSFSRFSNTRKPLKMNKSPENSNQSSPVMERSTLEKLAKPSPLTESYEEPKPRALSESSTASSSSHSSVLSQRKRRIGISCSESPLLSPVVSTTFFGESDSPNNKNLPPSSLGLDVDSLLASVEKKLGDLPGVVSKPGDDNNVSDVFESSTDSDLISASPNKSERPTQEHQSPANPPLPKLSPLLHKKSTGDQKGTDEKLTVVNIKLKNTGSSKQLSSPSLASKSVSKIKDEKPKSSKSPLSLKKSMDATTKSPKSETKKVASSNRPPKAPLTAKMSEPLKNRSSTSSTISKSASSMGTTRPRMIVMGDTSPKGKTITKMQSTPQLPATARRESGAGASTVSEAPKKSTESRRNSTLNRSMKSRASTRMIRPGSANVAGRRASVAATQQQQQQQNQMKEKKLESDLRSSDSRRPSLGPAASSARKSMRRVSSGDVLKKVRPGSSSTLGRDRRSSLAPPGTLSSGGFGGGVYATMRKSKSKTSIGPSGLTRSSATMSMRLPRKLSVAANDSVGPKGNTLRRGSKAGGGLPPAATVADPLVLSPSRSSTLKRMSSGGTLRKQSSTGEIISAFDQISSQAKMLVTSDHRRAVRPKARQKASASHLKILSNRADVSTDISNQEEEEGKLDPNTYSTYMAKKNLAPSAVAGLAAKVDFSTVKLRKTSALEQMISDQAGTFHDSSSASPGTASGAEYNTSHPVMLLQVKGRRNIQTRLVEPSGTSLNSGDVYIVVTPDRLFHWVGKAANVIEKARGSDVVMRIIHKKELGCKATAATVFKEEERASNLNSKKDEKFWELLGGKTGVKSSESVPGDEVYERAVCMATVVYKLEGTDKDSLQFVPIHENTTKMVSVDLLNTKQIFLFDFYSEMYVWIGNQSKAAFRRKAMELGKKLFDSGCKAPAFSLRNSPARSSGRYRPRGSMRSPRHSVTNLSGRRSSKVVKTDAKPRPEWALFARVTEGCESILFREKFGDWPEAGRIIKMKGHVSSGEVQEKPVIQVDMKPADVDKMLKDTLPFEGLRLEGDNIYRGQGNFKVSKSTFSRNRVRTVGVKKWVVKEFDNIIISGQNHGIFYTSEAYVIRWGHQITVVRELEGLGPGQGIFARDREYQRSLQEAKEGKGKAPPVKKEKRAPAPGDLLDSDSEPEEEENEEEKRLLESGGRDRCAYFFWQGENCTVNEKGASALMTVELDKEKGPQVRVEQGKEPPAFLNLFNGGMIILKGKSDTDSLQSHSNTVRVFSVHGQAKNETCLVEVTPEDNLQPLSGCLRSRGCYIIYDASASRVFVWYGCKSTKVLKRCATQAARMFRTRVPGVELVRANEGHEPNDLCSLLGKKDSYISLTNDIKKYDYTLRLFELTSTIGEFCADEVLCSSRNEEVNAFPFTQSNLYSVSQPAIFLVDGWTEVYIWLGWWPVEKNKLLKEANATTGSSHSRWLRDKKLAMETAQLYVNACKRTRTPRMYVVMAGSEHGRFKNLFPSWEENKTVQELNCKGRSYPTRLDLEMELAKYSRTQFKLEELKQKPPPEGVDPAKLETYLSDEDFLKVFKVTKVEFEKMAQWKQTDKKKAVGLF